MLDLRHNIEYTDSDARPSRFLVDLNGSDDGRAAGKAKGNTGVDNYGYTKVPFKERWSDFISEKKDFGIELLPQPRVQRLFKKDLLKKILMLSLFFWFLKTSWLSIKKSGRFFKALYKLLLWCPQFDHKRRVKSGSVTTRSRIVAGAPSGMTEIGGKKFFVRKYSIPRQALVFAAITLVISLPLKMLDTAVWAVNAKGKVMGVAESAVNDLKEAGSSLGEKEYGQAQLKLRSAALGVGSLEEDIGRIGAIAGVLAKIVPLKTIQAGQYADTVAQMIRESTAISQELSRMLGLLDDHNKVGILIKDIHDSLSRIAPRAQHLHGLIDSIEAGNIPDKYRDVFMEMKEKSLLVTGGVAELNSWFQVMYDALGYDVDRRYLLVFQNNSEMRASGGFIGSYALMDLRNGEIHNLEVPAGGSYDTEGGLDKSIIAPEPLWLVNPKWHFWDANWWPDWPMTANKLMWFYEHSGGPSVDGVLSFTPTVVEELLAVTGPIDMRAQYGVEVHSRNFWQVTQALAERKGDETNKPKQIIADLFDALIKQLPERLDKDMVLALVDLGFRMADQKQILAYFKNEKAQNLISSYNWAGEVLESAGDYLQVVNTNIAGAKTDREIEQDIKHELEVQKDGSVIAVTKITRSHTANKGEEFVGQRNVNWLRVYVPEGSELISAYGFKQPDDEFYESPDPSWDFDPDVLKARQSKTIDPDSLTNMYTELGKTVFANWSMIDPGEIETIYFKYKLPINLKPGTEFPILIQKQAGMKAGDLKLSIDFPAGLMPKYLELRNGMYIEEIEFEVDEFLVLEF